MQYSVSPILTIIIPTYNMEKYLRHCLDSLIVPNMEKVEVLVINDGSKDSSSAIAHEYQNKYPQAFRVIDKENGNYGSCINRGLKDAKGKYVKILDADDSFDKISYNNFIEALHNINADVVVTDYAVIDSCGNITESCTFNDKFEAYKCLSFYDYVCSSILSPLQMHALTYNRSIFKGLNYHQIEGVSYSDQQWDCEPMINVKSLYYLPITVYRYLIGRVGQTMENQFAHVRDLMAVVSEMLDFYKRHNLRYSKNEKYLRAIIESQLKLMYVNCLCKHSFSPKILKSFDLQLKFYPYFYDKIGNLSVGHLKYVKLWRIAGSLLTGKMISLYESFLKIELPIRLKIYNKIGI